jgi:hypothetical protein
LALVNTVMNHQYHTKLVISWLAEHAIYCDVLSQGWLD